MPDDATRHRSTVTFEVGADDFARIEIACEDCEGCRFTLPAASVHVRTLANVIRAICDHLHVELEAPGDTMEIVNLSE